MRALPKVERREVPSGLVRKRGAGRAEDHANLRTERPGNQVAFVVRSAMANRVGHSPDRFRFHRLVPGEVKLAANAAHGFSSEVGDQRSEIRGHGLASK